MLRQSRDAVGSTSSASVLTKRSRTTMESIVNDDPIDMNTNNQSMNNKNDPFSFNDNDNGNNKSSNNPYTVDIDENNDIGSDGDAVNAQYSLHGVCVMFSCMIVFFDCQSFETLHLALILVDV